MTKVATLIVDRSTDKEFDYLIPEELRERVQVGSRVKVSFGGRNSNLGTVIGISEESSVPLEKLKNIDGVIGDEPMVSPILIELARWMADYYCCSLELAIRSVLPQAVRGATVQPKSVQIVFFTGDQPKESDLQTIRKKAPRQADLLEKLIEITNKIEDGVIPVSTLLKQSATNHQTLKAVEKTGLITVSNSEVERDPHSADVFIPSKDEILTSEQAEALTAIQNSMAGSSSANNKSTNNKKPILLYGVTGSGKTEIYLQAISYCLSKSQTALVLVPEISLTPQTVERFKSRFASISKQVAVLHSHLSDGERYDEWHKINRGNAKIVIGARSAVFAPLKQLGLIVVDEEHENSYKQEETPRYHARDIAVLRGKLEGCLVILGSATPSLESFYNTKLGKYELLLLKNRIDDRKLPKIRIVDLRLEAQKQKSSSFAPLVLSEKLRSAIFQRLEKREQTILFLNRRGFATSLICPICGHVKQCDACSVSLTVHRSLNRLVCHLCGHQEVLPKVCPECKDPAIRQAGLGTERVEDVIKKVFPAAVIRRMDADSMTRKDSYREVLSLFRTGKIDILIGTQMIAKGLHFPNVTLVGIINADLGLHLPDFRAGEKTFQLLTQVAGRAGRGDVEGEVFVQTFTPFSPSIQYARHHDFDGFWDQESEFRKICGFPPFSHLGLLTIRCMHQELGKFSADLISRQLRNDLPNEIFLGEPAPAPLEKMKGYYRFQILMRGASSLRISRIFRRVLEKMTIPKEVLVTVDIDPYSLL